LIGLAGTEPHKVKTAGRALNNLRFRSNKNGAIYGVLTGLLCIIIFYTVLGSTYYASRDHISPGMLHGLQTMKVYLMGAVFGILGGIVSVTSRLSSYQQNLGGSRFFFVAMGITQPVIGSIFAIITIAIFEMKIISFAQVSISPLLDGDPTTLPFVIVVGFIAGFSERFTRGLIEKVAGMTGDAPDPGKPAPVAAPQATLPTLEAAND